MGLSSVLRRETIAERQIGDRDVKVDQAAGRENAVAARGNGQSSEFDLFREARLIYSRARLAQRTRRSSGII